MNRPDDKEVRKRRVLVEGAVRVTPRSGDPPKVFKYLDLSMGGLFVKTQNPLATESVVDLELRLMHLPFKTSATVAWVRSYETNPDKPAGMGFRFHELSPAQKRGLYLQIGEALEQGGEAMPGTPPSPADLAASSRAKKAGKGDKTSFWNRLIRSR